MQRITWTHKLKKHTLELYDSIEMLPINRFNKFNKFLMIEAGIGGTFEDVDSKHMAQLYRVAGDKDQTLKAIENFRQLFFNIYNGFSVKSLCFGILIYSYNGEEIKDVSETSLKDLMNRLSKKGLNYDLVKKKFKNYEKAFLMN